MVDPADFCVVFRKLAKAIVFAYSLNRVCSCWADALHAECHILGSDKKGFTEELRCLPQFICRHLKKLQIKSNTHFKASYSKTIQEHSKQDKVIQKHNCIQKRSFNSLLSPIFHNMQNLFKMSEFLFLCYHAIPLTHHLVNFLK